MKAELTTKIINNEKMWGKELSELPGFKELVIRDLKLIREKGMYEAMREVQGE